MRGDARDLGVEHVARQAVFGNAEAHHAARERAGFADRHAMAETGEMIGGRQARRAGADDEDAFAAERGGLFERPAFLDRQVAEKALDRIDADRLVDRRRDCTPFRTGDSRRGP